MNPSKSPPKVPFEEAPMEPRPGKNRKKLWLGLVLAFLLGGGALGVWRLLTPQSKPSLVPTANQGPPPRPVETTSLSAGRGIRTIELIGQVEASKIATIRSQTNGVVKEISVREGDRVGKGMTIATLDDTDQILGLKEARARLATQRSNLARLEAGTRKEIIAQRRASSSAAGAREREALDNLKRTETLVDDGALSQRALVEARAAVETAKGERMQAEATLSEAIAGPIPEEIAAQRANVEAALASVNQAEVELERTRIKAISAGIVRSRAVSVGDYLRSADPVITLVDSSELDIYLELPEELSGRVKPGEKVTLSARAFPDWKGSATISGVIPSTEIGSRRQRMRARSNDLPSGLISGMAVRGELELPTNVPTFVVSRDALTRKQDEWLIFTVVDGKAKQLPVEMVADMGEKVAIYNEALRSGQTIILRGGDGLADGMPVKTVGSKS